MDSIKQINKNLLAYGFCSQLPLVCYKNNYLSCERVHFAKFQLNLIHLDKFKSVCAQNLPSLEFNIILLIRIT